MAKQSTTREAVAGKLAHALADTYAVYMKTHGFHWNVVGPDFQPLHEEFEKQYRELWEAVDEIAERIRALNTFAPGSFADLLELTAIREERGVPVPAEMLRQLVADHETTLASLREARKTAEAAGDDATVNLLDDRLTVHEKTAWMLRSLLERPADSGHVAQSVRDKLAGGGPAHRAVV